MQTYPRRPICTGRRKFKWAHYISACPALSRLSIAVGLSFRCFIVYFIVYLLLDKYSSTFQSFMFSFNSKNSIEDMFPGHCVFRYSELLPEPYCPTTESQGPGYQRGRRPQPAHARGNGWHLTSLCPRDSQRHQDFS